MPENAKRILHIEDDPHIRAFTRKILETSGFELVSTAEAKPELLPPAAAYDLVILDLMMPGTDGLVVARQLRAQGYTGPLIILSSKTLVGDERGVIQNLGARFVPKPCGPRDLLHHVRQCLAEGS